MWAPGYQTVTDAPTLWSAITRWSFATLICAGDGGAPHATQIPFITRDGHLYGHLARANPQSTLVSEGRAILCHFAGPHAYVSPAWYAQPGQVPTWNYAQVQVRGRPRVMEGDDALWVVRETVSEHESHRPEPVTFDVMAETAGQILGGITAFEVEIEDMFGRFKLSQNKSVADQASVVEQLRAGDAMEAAVAALMEDRGGQV